MRQSAPFAGVPLELADGTPIKITVEKDQATETLTQTGWMNMKTGVFTAGPPPLGIRPAFLRGLRGPTGPPGLGNGLQVYNVLDFGGQRTPFPAAYYNQVSGGYTGTGFPTFDSSAAVAAAIAQIRSDRGAGIVYFPQGLWSAQLPAQAGLHYMGDGIGETAIQVPSGKDSILFGDPTSTSYLDGFALEGMTMQGRRQEAGNTGRGIDIRNAGDPIGQGHITPYIRDVFLFDFGTEAVFIGTDGFGTGRLVNVTSFWSGRTGFWLETDSVHITNCGVSGNFGWASFILSKGVGQLTACKAEVSWTGAETAPIPAPATDTPSHATAANSAAGFFPPAEPFWPSGHGYAILGGFGPQHLNGCASEFMSGAGIYVWGNTHVVAPTHRFTSCRFPVILHGVDSATNGYSDIGGVITAGPNRDIPAKCGVALLGKIGPGNEVRLKVAEDYSPGATGFVTDPADFQFVRRVDAHASHLDTNVYEMRNVLAKKVGSGATLIPDAFTGLVLSIVMTSDVVLNDVADRFAVMPGDRMRVVFEQDVVGGHVVTVGGSYVNAPVIDVTPGAITAVVFVNVSHGMSPTWMVESTSPSAVPSAGVPPSSISGLLQWNKSSDIALGDGAPVPNWPAAAGTALVQAVVADQPTLHLNALNGLAAVRFDGVAQFMTFPAGTSHAQPFDVIAVGKWNDLSVTASSTSLRSIVAGKTTPGQDMGIDVQYQAAGMSVTAQFTCHGSAEVTSPRTADLSPHMFDMVCDPSSNVAGQLYVDGHEAFPGGGNVGGGVEAYTALTVGAGIRAGTGAPTTFSNCDVFEVCVFDHVLTLADRRQLRRYFRDRYGLPIAI